MAKNTKQTSRPVASKASKVLRDGRYSKTSKSVAGSALSQARPKKKSRSTKNVGREEFEQSACPSRKGVNTLRQSFCNSNDRLTSEQMFDIINHRYIRIRSRNKCKG